MNTREEYHWPHAWQRLKRRSNGVKLNGILECKFLFRKPEDRAGQVQGMVAKGLVAKGFGCQGGGNKRKRQTAASSGFHGSLSAT